jgi:hypothetical protein
MVARAAAKQGEGGSMPGSVAKIAAGHEWLRQEPDQAAIWNNPAVKVAWARRSASADTPQLRRTARLGSCPA